MRRIPIVLTFDNNLALPAAVCISSLLQSANNDTCYDIFVLYSGKKPEIVGLPLLCQAYRNMNVYFRNVGSAFSGAYEVRGITKAAYYRLLAAKMIPEHNKVIYADVDTIFRLDLSEVYDVDLKDNYMGAVYAQTINTSSVGQAYLKSIGLTPGDYFCSGFLLMDLQKMRENNLTEKFIELARNNYKYQDQDIINIVCRNKIQPLPFIYHMSVSAFDAVSNQYEIIGSKYYELPYKTDSLKYSNIHYNGVKPWDDWCPNLDQWWECYRKSPIYDPKYYYCFFSGKRDALDKLSLLKRMKILVRYFTIGRKI